MGGVGRSNPGKRIVFVAFARSISQTLSVFSASFWPEWRANNCRRGNVRGLGNLHAANFAKLHRGSSAHLHKCNQKGGIKFWVISEFLSEDFSAGSTICQSSLYCRSFSAARPQIDSSAQDHSAGFRLCLLKGSRKSPRQDLSFLSLPFLRWTLTLRWQAGAKSHRIWTKCKIPGYNGPQGYKSEIMQKMSILKRGQQIFIVCQVIFCSN